MELMLLFYFDCVCFYIIDFMYNFFIGIVKYVMKNVWLDLDKLLFEKKDLEKIQEKMDKFKVLVSVGRMLKKIENSYGGFIVDQWKLFIILFFIYVLWNLLLSVDLEFWCDFVLVCLCLCFLVIIEIKVLLVYFYFLKFCQSFEQLYGKYRVILNMYLYFYFVDCVLDFGLVYLFWLFSFECYNGIFGEYGIN